MKLSPAMIAAIKGAAPDGTVQGATRQTEHALIARKLAVPVYGMTVRRNRYSRHAQTVYDVYLGARLITDRKDES